MRLLRKISFVFLALFTVVLLIFIDILFEVNVPKALNVNIDSSKIADDKPIRIIQISDTHGSPVSSHYLLIKEVSNFKPDAIFLTGDIIDKSTTDFSGVYSDVRNILKIAPIFFVTGNHEFANPRGEEFISGLRDMGVIVLRNERNYLNNVVSVAGIEDVHSGKDDIKRATEGLSRDTFNIFLSHTPSSAFDLRGEEMIDLVLAGHTHGGQIRLPFLGAVFLPDRVIDNRLIKGLTTLENGITVYVDSGFGTSVIPVRFMDQSQISLITIH